jgi:hypothetical protein
MKLDAVTVTIDPLIEEGGIEYHRVDAERYPKDFYWLFSGCDETWGNQHDLCAGDVKLRNGFRGHCVCGCHR